MIRRYNYTKRVRISGSRVKVTVRDAAVMSFDAEINVGDLGLPDDANLVLVANSLNRAQRFHYGQVGNVKQPADRRLTEMSVIPHFRFLVVESSGSGRLLAIADNIRPKPASVNGNDGLQSLLWVREADIGDQVWRLNFSGHTTLELNRSIPRISETVRSDKRFRSLVIPEAFRSILRQMLLVNEYDPDDHEGEYDWADWIAMIRAFQPEEIPSGDDRESAALNQWIEDTVSLFAKDRFNAADLYQSAAGL